ncbi:MAG: 50S ribosome-binding GTPase [Methyloprofundus sp.]|nr:50S ribosome-binding GTPase [Methyloprofundus sp.]
MLEFITTLKHRYQTVQVGEKAEKCTEQLTFIEAFLQKTELDRLPINIGVIGPTQSGKSSVVNLLLNQESAGVSPLAGYTVHPQGFSIAQKADDLIAIKHYFADIEEVPQSSLDHQQYDCYSLSACQQHHLPACIVWDTPDFDSIDAQSYKKSVLKTVALADILVLVVSKEKYADQSVWDVLELIAPLKQPIIVVLNKLVPDSEALIIESFTERWQQLRTDKTPEIMPFLFTKGGLVEEHQEALNRLVKTHIKQVQRKNQQPLAKQFIQAHWDDWLVPIKAEQIAEAQWLALIEAVLEEGLDNYKRDYLDHPHHYDTFQNALARLLTLLEVPGVAKVLGKSRRILTWPMRKLFSKGRSKMSAAFPATQETVVLQQIAEHLLLQVGDKVLNQIDPAQGWWKLINQQLRLDKAHILQQFEQKTFDYHENFKHEIDETAQGLYRKLEEHPAILNSLRATRVTADAAMLVLVLQAGGIGLHDLLIAPAMLSLTAYLAESAVGGYLHKAEQQLKQRQLKAVQQQLLQQVIQQSLKQLPEKMTSTHYFNISTQQLAEVEAQLKEKPHGLRLF